jgi:hypothetical protein
MSFLIDEKPKFSGSKNPQLILIVFALAVVVCLAALFFVVQVSEESTPDLEKKEILIPAEVPLVD